MSVTVPDPSPTLEFLGLFADQTEDVIMARLVAWANEGLDPVANAEQWTDTREGGHWYMTANLAVREFARQYDFMGTEIPMCAFVLWAWGTYLDDLAAVFNVQRLAATPAVGFVTFSGPAGTDIGEGTTVTVIPSTADDPAPEFAVVLEGTIPDLGGGEGEMDLPIQATEAGSAGDVAANAITGQSTPLPDGVTLTNAAATGGGDDAETDDALRLRVLQATSGSGPGNQADMLRWALAFPGVSTAKVVPTWEGPNSALITIGDQNGQPLPSAIVDGLQTQLDPVAGEGAGTAPVGQQITVATPEMLSINVSSDVLYEAGYSADGSGNTVALAGPIGAAINAYMITVVAGDDVVLSHVAGIIATYPGVKDATDVQLNGAGANITLTLTPTQAAQLGTLTI